MELDLQVSPEEIMIREGLRTLDFFCFELSKLFINSSATNIVFVTLSKYSSRRSAMVRGHRLNTSIVLVAVHGLFRAVSAVEPSLFRPLPTLSPSLISHLASVDIKQQRRRRRWFGCL